MEENGYTWWIQRINRALDLYDEFRIDHFRGFAGYWAVPAGQFIMKEKACAVWKFIHLYEITTEHFMNGTNFIIHAFAESKVAMFGRWKVRFS